MKKLLILLLWLLGMALIAWLCLRGLSATRTAEAPTPTTASPGAGGLPATIAGTPVATAKTATGAAPAPMGSAGGSVESSTATPSPAGSGSVASPAAAPGTSGTAGAAGAAGATGVAADGAAAAAGAVGAGGATAGSAGAAKARIDELLGSKVIEFESSRAVLKASGQETAAEIAKILQDYPSVKVEVRGHTDPTGPADVNHAISHLRADAVKSVLVSQGIEAERITPTGYGSTQPVADNRTAEGRARNRRIDFHVEEGQ